MKYLRIYKIWASFRDAALKQTKTYLNKTTDICVEKIDNSGTDTMRFAFGGALSLDVRGSFLLQQTYKEQE